MITVVCPSCGKSYRVKDEYAGKKFRCKGCEATVPIPAPQRAVDVLDEFDDFGGLDDYGEFDDSESELPPRPRKPATKSKSGSRSSARKKRGKRKSKSSNKTGLIAALSTGGAGVAVAVILIVIRLFGAFAGSGAYDQHDKAAQEVVDLLDDLGDAFESVKDANSAKTAAVEINRICDEMDALIDRTKKLPLITRREDQRLRDKYEPQLEAVKARMERVAPQAGFNSQGEASFIAAVTRLEAMGNKMQRIGNSWN